MGFVVLLAGLGSLLDCTDDGPWPCTEIGCPSDSIDCTALASLEYCDSPFSEIWTPPPSGTESAFVSSRCPRACGRCGVSSPDVCNVDHIDARSIHADELATALINSRRPLMIRNAIDAGPSLDDYGELPVQVTTEGGRYQGESTSEQPLLLRDFVPALQNGSLPDNA